MHIFCRKYLRGITAGCYVCIMEITNNYREVTPTAQEIAAMADIMSGEIKKMIAMGMNKNQILATLKMYQHDLSQKAFRAAK